MWFSVTVRKNLNHIFCVWTDEHRWRLREKKHQTRKCLAFQNLVQLRPQVSFSKQTMSFHHVKKEEKYSFLSNAAALRPKLKVHVRYEQQKSSHNHKIPLEQHRIQNLLIQTPQKLQLCRTTTGGIKHAPAEWWRLCFSVRQQREHRVQTWRQMIHFIDCVVLSFNGF